MPYGVVWSELMRAKVRKEVDDMPHPSPPPSFETLGANLEAVAASMWRAGESVAEALAAMGHIRLIEQPIDTPQNGGYDSGMTKTSTAPAARFTVDTYASGSDLTIGDGPEYQVVDSRTGDLVMSTSRQDHAVEFAGNLNARLSK